MARSAQFNWSKLTRDNIIQLMKTCGSFVIGQSLTPSEIQKIFSKTIKYYLPIKVTKSIDKTTEKGWVYTGGYFHTEKDKIKHQSIEVVFSYNPLDKRIVITRERFNRICRRLADVVMHEMIHMRQARARNFKSIPGFSSYAENNKQRKEQNYLGDPDEIDAYAFNIACELYDRFSDFNVIANHLNLDQSDKRLKKDTYNWYLKTFDHKHNHTVIKKLKKRVMHYVPYAELGKPYKTTDWLR
jgi:hypothetical protein